MEQEAKLIVNESKDDQKVFVWGQGDFELGINVTNCLIFQELEQMTKHFINQRCTPVVIL